MYSLLTMMEHTNRSCAGQIHFPENTKSCMETQIFVKMPPPKWRNFGGLVTPILPFIQKMGLGYYVHHPGQQWSAVGLDGCSRMLSWIHFCKKNGLFMTSSFFSGSCMRSNNSCIECVSVWIDVNAPASRKNAVSFMRISSLNSSLS